MSLKVIGAGWGRTGTESLKLALEQLGFDKCYHAYELLAQPSHIKYWKQLQSGEKPDYEALFRGYQAAVDFPASYHYRELMRQYPQAKIILTIREPSEWYESAAKTIFQKPEPRKLALLGLLRHFSQHYNYIYQITDYAHTFLFQQILEGKTDDKEAMLAFFNNWNEAVIKTVPSRQLLVYQVKDGWEPLCRFLNVPIPASPFPKLNEQSGFKERIDEKILEL